VRSPDRLARRARGRGGAWDAPPQRVGERALRSEASGRGPYANVCRNVQTTKRSVKTSAGTVKSVAGGGSGVGVVPVAWASSVSSMGNLTAACRAAALASRRWRRRSSLAAASTPSSSPPSSRSRFFCAFSSSWHHAGQGRQPKADSMGSQQRTGLLRTRKRSRSSRKCGGKSVGSSYLARRGSWRGTGSGGPCRQDGVCTRKRPRSPCRTLTNQGLPM
jgi:hypothetical protein